MAEIFTEVLINQEEQAILKRCKQGEQVALDRLPDDDTNKDAIRIKRLSGEVLGYLEQHACNLIAPRIDEGVEIQAIIRRIDGGGPSPGGPLRCHLRLSY